MNEYWNILVAAFTVVSIIIILLTFVHPFDNQHLLGIYIFDIIVTIFLAVDFYLRIRTYPQKLKFMIAHWYEFLAMVPLVVFIDLDALTVTNNLILSFKLITFFRLVRLYN